MQTSDAALVDAVAATTTAGELARDEEESDETFPTKSTSAESCSMLMSTSVSFNVANENDFISEEVQDDEAEEGDSEAEGGQNDDTGHKMRDSEGGRERGCCSRSPLDGTEGL